jgi:hypothetical protein
MLNYNNIKLYIIYFQSEFIEIFINLSLSYFIYFSKIFNN